MLRAAMLAKTAPNVLGVKPNASAPSKGISTALVPFTVMKSTQFTRAIARKSLLPINDFQPGGVRGVILDSPSTLDVSLEASSPLGGSTPCAPEAMAASRARRLRMPGWVSGRRKAA
eukprot:scaffold621232_cov45-Prasinocladus_malaysianus.AAC.1